ncbi:ABC transporter permease [Blautia sp.]|uniref:ABC transporter permease n=1 Tax=Blautia sp. TaxID=1955243 RepID=UPI002588C2C3|nr:ABC transporter permease [Blautia sp.]
MKNTIQAVYLKNRRINKRAYPWSFIMQRIIGGILSLCFPLFIYYFVFNQTLSKTFFEYSSTYDYVTYVVSGESVYIVAFATLMNVSRCMILEIREGTLDTFLLSPASRFGYFIGTYFEQLIRSLFEFSVLFITGILLGARFNLNDIFILLTVLVFISLCCFSMSILLASIMVFTRDTYLTQNTIITLIGLFSGILFPIELMPEQFQLISYMIPITYGLKLFRNCIIAQETLLNNLVLLLLMFFTSIIYLISGFIILKKSESNLIEEIYS